MNTYKKLSNLTRVTLFTLVILSLALSLISCTGGDASSSDTSGSGAVAPDFTVYDRLGNEVHLSDFSGEPVVINFWATWCTYCVQEMPDFNKAYIAYPNVNFLMINATDGVNETEKKATDYVDSEGFGFNIYFDTESEAQTAYRVNAYPMTFFVNASGEFVSRHRGKITYSALISGIESIT